MLPNWSSSGLSFTGIVNSACIDQPISSTAAFAEATGYKYGEKSGD
jgi:hypothetical protein